MSRAGGPTHIAFLALVVMNLVGGFLALGTLLAVGMMIVMPAVISRFWARDITGMIGVAVASAAVPGLCGPACFLSRRPAVGSRRHLNGGRSLRAVGVGRTGRRCAVDRLASASPDGMNGDGHRAQACNDAPPPGVGRS